MEKQSNKRRDTSRDQMAHIQRSNGKESIQNKNKGAKSFDVSPKF